MELVHETSLEISVDFLTVPILYYRIILEMCFWRPDRIDSNQLSFRAGFPIISLLDEPVY